MTDTPDTSASDPTTAKKVYRAISKNHMLVQIPMPPWHVAVSRWNSTHEARGWTLTAADLTLPGGRPFGSLLYTRTGDQKTVRVGVRWDVDRELPETLCLHPTKPQPARNRDAIDADALELDALARCTALMSANAFIGAGVMDLTAETAILEAAGLGLRRIFNEPEDA